MVNKVVLIGNIGRDPELFHTQNGQAVARLSVATNQVWMKDGERQRRTEWQRVVVWGPPAERLTAQLHKGAQVYIEGRLRTRSFTDADNTSQVRTEIHAQRAMPLLTRRVRDAGLTAAATEDTRDGDDVPF
jgi:single-strand DNA-binding protein